MKLGKTFTTIRHSKGQTALDYPSNLPLPRVGETVIFQNEYGFISGIVILVQHTITNNVADIKIVIS